VVPDIVFVSRERLGMVTERAVEGAPDLIVEALSPGTERKDRVEKSRLYARHGVRHYWLADPAFQILQAFELGEGGYRLAASLGAEEVYAPALFPALTILLRELWG
jgi:Uma2 family endonuclease